MINKNPRLPVTAERRALDIARSTAYYPTAAEVSAEDLEQMRQIDEIYLQWPVLQWQQLAQDRFSAFFGVLHWNPFYAPSVDDGSKHRSGSNYFDTGGRIHPCHLSGLNIDRPNQGLGDRDHLHPDGSGGHGPRRHLEEALSRYQSPEIFSTDQGAQFTAAAFTEVLKVHPIQSSIGRKHRRVDNAFVERLWPTVMYEHIRLRAYERPAELRSGLHRYFQTCHTWRGHPAPDR